MKATETLRNCHTLEETKEIVMTKRHVGFWNRGRPLVKKLISKKTREI